MIRTALNQYRITASIGAGGMGEVFRARDTRLNRDVAVKARSSSRQDFRRRFRTFLERREIDYDEEYLFG